MVHRIYFVSYLGINIQIHTYIQIICGIQYNYSIQYNKVIKNTGFDFEFRKSKHF